jgi:hypothetical protein
MNSRPALRAAAARPASAAEPGRRARPQRNASRPHDLTGQPTYPAGLMDLMTASPDA